MYYYTPRVYFPVEILARPILLYCPLLLLLQLVQWACTGMRISWRWSAAARQGWWPCRWAWSPWTSWIRSCHSFGWRIQEGCRASSSWGSGFALPKISKTGAKVDSKKKNSKGKEKKRKKSDDDDDHSDDDDEASDEEEDEDTSSEGSLFWINCNLINRQESLSSANSITLNSSAVKPMRSLISLWMISLIVSISVFFQLLRANIPQLINIQVN